MPTLKQMEDTMINRAYPWNAVTASALALAATAALSACGSKPPKQLPPPPPVAAAAPVAPAAPQLPAPGSQADFVRTMMGQDTIHFAYDKSDIDPVAVSALQAQARWLMRYPNKRATIEGHTDERGTREYNLALGERRAEAAKNYLASLGVDPARLNVISYGKERPLDPASNEAAWAKNRRAVTVTID